VFSRKTTFYGKIFYTFGSKSYVLGVNNLKRVVVKRLDSLEEYIWYSNEPSRFRFIKIRVTKKKKDGKLLGAGILVQEFFDRSRLTKIATLIREKEDWVVRIEGILVKAEEMEVRISPHTGLILEERPLVVVFLPPSS